MPDVAYFKKNDPFVKLHLGSGEVLAFSDVGGNLGILVTNKPVYISAIRAVIRQGVGGVSEITGAEYGELQKKKMERSSTNLREQVSSQQIRDAGRLHRSAADAAKGGPSVSVRGGKRLETIKAVEYKPVLPGYRPSSAKR